MLTLQEMTAEAVSLAFPESVWVKAEIASISVKSNGHCYLELSQVENGAVVAKARAAIWRSRYSQVARDFCDATGSTQQRREPIERLEKEGLMDLQKELCLPLLPYRLAVISAATAAGLGDFRKHLNQNPYGFRFEVVLLEATMQGENAPASIIEALTIAENAAEPFDAILILRGGGSDLDLACFDDYDLAATIARCTVPVFTAIGHERDYHVADMVANTFVKTPTALADLFLDCYISEDQRISTLEAALKTAFTARVTGMELRLQAALTAVKTAALGRLANEEAHLGLLEVKIASSDPSEILKKGYSLVTDAAGVKMTSSKGTRKGDKIYVAFPDGRLHCTVDSVEKPG